MIDINNAEVLAHVYLLCLLAAALVLVAAACGACHWFIDRRAAKAFGPHRTNAERFAARIKAGRYGRAE